MSIELVDKELANGSFNGIALAYSARILIRAPRKVLVSASGLTLVKDRFSHHWKDVVELAAQRCTKAVLAEQRDVIAAEFGAEAADALQEAWRESKTILVDGGGKPCLKPGHQLRDERNARYAISSCDWRADLTGQVKTCRQCGANLKPRTDHHRLDSEVRADHPRTLEDCQRLTNLPVIAIHGFDQPEEKWGYVKWFETWDGESLQDPFFCDNACAAKFGRRAAEAALQLPVGVEPTEQPYEPRQDVHHYDQEAEAQRSRAWIERTFQQQLPEGLKV